MKQIILLSFVMLLGGCAGSGGGGSSGGSSGPAGACASTAILGTWTGRLGPGAGDILTINADCTFTDTQCALAGTYPNDTLLSDTVTLNITTSAGGACPATGTGTLQYNDLSGSLFVKFNGGASSTYGQ